MSEPTRHVIIRSALTVRTETSDKKFESQRLVSEKWGWIDEWMRQGMPEDPDEIALLSAQMNQNNAK